MGKRDYRRELIEAAGAARINGWTILNATTLTRVVAHDTPHDIIRNGWYAGQTYDSVEFLSFVLVGGGAPKAVYGTSANPWVQRLDRPVSFKRAKELLAQPVSHSDFHS